MHIGRTTQRRQNGERAVYLLLRHNFRDSEGITRQRTVYLGPEIASDIAERAAKAVRRRGYTPAQTRAIVDAVRARVDRDEHLPITVRGKPVEWRESTDEA